ncbi:MAG TPA: GNAT family N-acetyltransferase [Pyrinomonadaceae bacterium]
MKLQFHTATPDRWSDVEELFGERGACGGCWCMYWRLPRGEWTASKGLKNRNSFRKIVNSDQQPGIIAYDGAEPIGWCAVAPREVFTGLAKSRVLKPVDERPVWSITCLFVKKSYRRRGVSLQLIKAAVNFAQSQGADIVEGYPTAPTMEKTPDPFVYMGVPSAFIAAGFKEVARRSPSRPVMRYEMKTSVVEGSV